MKFKILIIFFVAFCLGKVDAQISDTAVLRNYINANIVPNSTRSITATILNNSLIGLLNVQGRYKVDTLWTHGDTLFYRVGGIKRFVLVSGGVSGVDTGHVSNDTLFLHKATGTMIAIKMGYYTADQSDARYKPIGYIPVWTEITGKPTTFPPSSHSHVINDVTNLQTALDGKVNTTDTAAMLAKYLRKGDTASLSNRINLAIPLSQKAANNGVAPLGSDGKVPAAYLPAGAQVYKGTWDASTNAPALADGTGTAGWTYRVTVGATRNLGSGNITFNAGDDVIYNGAIWQRNPNGATVTSVNGYQGAVSLTTEDITEGATNKYVTATDKSNWNTSFGWGNHAVAGYLTATTGDARYPLLSGSYSNPAWVTALAWSKVTGAPAFITGNQSIALTGDVTGSGATGIVTALKSVGTAGTYTKVTTDAQGRVSAGTTLAATDIPALDAGKVTTGVIPVARGGTGIGTIGTAGQLTRVNTGATALEYFTPAFLTGNQTITATGDATGFGTTTLPLTLKSVGTAGTYTKVSTDAQGRVTSGTGIDTTDIPSFSTKVRPLLSGSGPITFGNTTGAIGWNGTTTNVPEGTNLYWTNARGDGRYPLLTGSYANPSWLASLPWSKITGTPTTLAGYGITDAAPGSGSGNYIQNQSTVAQSANLWMNGVATAGAFRGYNPVAATSGDFLMYEGVPSTATLRWRWIRTTAEAAGNVGNNLSLQSYDNTGNILSTPFSITRSTGVAAFSQIPTAGGNPLFTDANHPAGGPNSQGSGLTGATVYSNVVTNSAGHLTSVSTRSLTPVDIGAAPATGSGNYIQNQTTSAQSGVGFWTTGIGIANSGFQSNVTLGAAHQNFNTPAGIRRFTITLGTTETGSNVGSDFAINRHNDAGTLIGPALVISRATGLVQAVSGYRGATGSGVYRSGANSLLYFYDTDNATRLGYTGDVNGDAYLVSDNGNVNLRPGAANTSFTLTPTTLNLSTGLLSLTNTASNLLSFANIGSAAPTFNTTSIGTKLKLWSEPTSTNASYAIGVEGAALWYSIPTSVATTGFKWYGGITEVSRLDGIGSQQWAGQGRFKGWINNTWATGIGAEVGTTGGIATFAGVDRSASPAAYAPVQIIGGTGTPTGNIFTINGSGYTFSNLPNISSLGTDATGKLINTTANFIQNQTSAAQSGVGFWTAGAGIANRFAAYGPVASTNGDIGLYEGTSAAGANQRWRFIRSTAEAAGNVGNNLLLQAMDNTGNSLFNALSITRSTGVVTTPQGLYTPTVSAPATNDLSIKTDMATRFYTNGSETVTISAAGILSVGNSSPSTIRASPLQVQGNIWSTDAYILGTTNVPTGEFGIGGSDVFVRTMGAASVLLQTNSSTTVAKANGATNNFEVTNQIKIGGGTPGTGKFLMSSDAAGTAVWSSGEVKSVRVITANYTAVAEDNTIINRATTGTPVITLPAASSNTGRVYTIVEEAANATANGVVFSAVLLRGTTYTSFNNPVLSGKSRITIQSDGSSWVIIGGM